MMIAMVIILVLLNILLWSDVFYKQFFKRFYDIISSVLALTIFCWLYGLIAILVRYNLGQPIFFTQVRPGKKRKDGKEKLFKLYKFRTMTDERDENGILLPDKDRLTKFGAFLRSTSLDEIPEAINILKGDMSVIGPRPQLVRDMVFMTEEQRKRYDVRPGLSGLAQVNGRNAITWEQKFEWDLKYIEDVSFINDLTIVLKTLKKAFVHDASQEEETNVTLDYGDALLNSGMIDQERYNQLLKVSDSIITEFESRK